MKAIVAQAGELTDTELEIPHHGELDLLVNVKAISVNPVDYKVRAAKHQGSAASTEPRVLGWDAAGVVVDVGPQVNDFKVGDEVFYAGELNRPGSNAEFQAVDSRIVGRRPQSISLAESAALPLTSITAWELLFDRLGVIEGQRDAAILISGAAGGVGSMLVQLARKLTGLTVIATASRPETVTWSKRMGAHHVIDHTKPLSDQLSAIGIPHVPYIASLTGTARNFPQLVEVLSPQGKIGLIDDPQTLDVVPLKRKSGSIHWEFMFARSMWKTPDVHKQGELLNQISVLVDQGKLQPTQTQIVSPINAANLKAAHAILESGKAIGKVTLSGF